jgi:hypothetical protein
MYFVSQSVNKAVFNLFPKLLKQHNLYVRVETGLKYVDKKTSGQFGVAFLVQKSSSPS